MMTPQLVTTTEPTVDRALQSARNLVLVVADPDDGAAAALASRIGDNALFVVPRALSSAGWTWLPDPGARTGTTGAIRFKATQLAGVFTRLASIAPYQITHVATVDREYVAAEMTAFLRAWLTGLPCILLNPPTNLSLTGPAWNPEHWAMLGSRLGIPTAPVSRRAPDPSQPPTDSGATAPARPVRITVSGEHVINPQRAAPALVDRARALATAARTPLLEVTFDDTTPAARLTGATCWPDLTTPGVHEILAATLTASTGFQGRW